MKASILHGTERMWRAVPDYTALNLADKVVRIILGYIYNVYRTVGRHGD